MKLKKLNSSQILWETLRKHGIDTVFGLPGNSILPLYEALRSSFLHSVLAGSETSAAFMANGYYRACGRPSAVLVSMGPGFIYALPGIAQARHDSIPVILIVSYPGVDSGKMLRFQAVDQEALARPLFKKQFIVDRPDDTGKISVLAYEHAMEGEPGPVLIQIDPAVMNLPSRPVPDSLVVPTEAPPENKIDQAFCRIKAGDKIVFFLGQGALDARDEISEMVELLKAAVITTTSARGILPESLPRCVAGEFSQNDDSPISRLIKASDLVVAIGNKFSTCGFDGENLKIPREKLIHVDKSEKVLNACYPAELAVCGDVGYFARSMVTRIREARLTPSGWPEDMLFDFKQAARKEVQSALRMKPQLVDRSKISWQLFFDEFSRYSPDDTLLVTDAGLHQLITRAYIRLELPRSLVVPTNFQSMGFGLPAAIGAKLAAPERNVVLMSGDGGMAMTGMELFTAARESLDLTVCIFNDGYLGQIRNRQIERYGRDCSVKLKNPDYEFLAKSAGASYFRFQGPPGPFFEHLDTVPGLKLVEIKLADSPRLGRAKLTGRAKNHIRKLAGHSGAVILRNIFRK